MASKPDMVGYAQDAAAAALELMDEVQTGEIWDWNEDHEWDVQNAAIDFLRAIERFRSHIEMLPVERHEGPSNAERL